VSRRVSITGGLLDWAQAATDRIDEASAELFTRRLVR